MQIVCVIILGQQSSTSFTYFCSWKLTPLCKWHHLSFFFTGHGCV